MKIWTGPHLKFGDLIYQMNLAVGAPLPSLDLVTALLRLDLMIHEKNTVKK